MIRTQIQIDEATYQLLRTRAFSRKVSLAVLAREALREYLGIVPREKRRVEDFRFIGSGGSEQGTLAPVSERHDEALEEDFGH